MVNLTQSDVQAEEAAKEWQGKAEQLQEEVDHWKKEAAKQEDLWKKSEEKVASMRACQQTKISASHQGPAESGHVLKRHQASRPFWA